MAEIIPFPDKQYQIIYADPPWSYNDKMRGHSFSLDHEYETQPLNWIEALPVKDLAAKDSVLFLWATSPLLPEAFEVIRAWGFQYKTIAFAWVKTSKNGKWVYNLGRWTMASTEMVLLATRGRPQRIIKNVKQLVIAERTVHSKKPNEVRDRIIELMGDLPRIELFARARVEGWDSWGDEVA
jgi:N6-adenosine-specific RNA methylase IME4